MISRISLNSSSAIPIQSSKPPVLKSSKCDQVSFSGNKDVDKLIKVCKQYIKTAKEIGNTRTFDDIGFTMRNTDDFDRFKLNFIPKAPATATFCEALAIFQEKQLSANHLTNSPYTKKKAAEWKMPLNKVVEHIVDNYKRELVPSVYKSRAGKLEITTRHVFDGNTKKLNVITTVDGFYNRDGKLSSLLKRERPDKIRLLEIIDGILVRPAR